MMENYKKKKQQKIKIGSEKGMACTDYVKLECCAIKV